MTSLASAAAIGTLTTCQEKALDILQREGNIFLTGAAGTGKSFLLSRYLRDKPSDAFPIVASTGAAAVLIGGRTFHSFFGLGIMEGGLEATVARALKSRKLVQRLLSASCVIIDEVSMLSGATLMAAEMIARKVRNIDLPWGNLRIIAVGDFAQLPPVTQGMQLKDWAFQHAIWKETDFQPALLSTVMRTQDVDFLNILNFVRAGTVNDDVRDFLNDHMIDSSEEAEGTRLYPHRAKADEYNLRKLHSIPGSIRSIQTHYEGSSHVLESARRSLPIPDVLQIKEGALVMMRKNDPSEEQLYVNGSLGYVRDITEDTLTIRLLQGGTIEVEQQKFSCLDGDGQELLSAWNFPVTLAWATTIHKAQGASLDSMIVDLSSLWEPGQAYVAMSRVRSAQGLHVERWSERSIRAEPLVTSFYDSMTTEMEAYVPRPLFTVRALFTKPTVERTRKKSKSEDRMETIEKLLRENRPIERIAGACGMNMDQLLKLIEKMQQNGTRCDLSYLADDVDSYDAIRRSFEDIGLARLKPVYEDLKEEFDYETLRLVRCIIVAEECA